MIKKFIILSLLQLATTNLILPAGTSDSQSSHTKESTDEKGTQEKMLGFRTDAEGRIYMNSKGQEREVSILEALESWFGPDFSQQFNIKEETNIEKNIENIVRWTQALMDEFINTFDMARFQALMTIFPKILNVYEQKLRKTSNGSREHIFYQKLKAVLAASMVNKFSSTI